MEKLSINHWDEAERPREKLQALGANVLTDAELLAILIGSGNAEMNAVELMKEVLKSCNNDLALLSRMSVEDLRAFKGIGLAKAVTIRAACELGNRREQRKAQDRTTFCDVEQVYRHFYPRIRDYATEHCFVLLLDRSMHLLREVEMSSGGLTETVVDVRRILHDALLANATCMVLCHNHPSGNTKPSRQDDVITARLKEASTVMGISLLDHVILTDGAYYSYSSEGRL